VKHSLISADPGQGSVVGFCEYGDELPYSVEMAFNVHNLLLRLVFFFFCSQDFVGAGFCRGNSVGTEQQRIAAMICEGCSVKFTVFKRKVSPFVNEFNKLKT
jgi:hypothetical protein